MLFRSIVHLDDALHERAADLLVRALVQGALSGEDHVVGGKVVPVVELHALAQLADPGGRRCRRPGLGQRRNQLQVRGRKGAVEGKSLDRGGRRVRKNKKEAVQKRQGIQREIKGTVARTNPTVPVTVVATTKK